MHDGSFWGHAGDSATICTLDTTVSWLLITFAWCVYACQDEAALLFMLVEKLQAPARAINKTITERVPPLNGGVTNIRGAGWSGSHRACG